MARIVLRDETGINISSTKLNKLKKEVDDNVGSLKKNKRIYVASTCLANSLKKVCLKAVHLVPESSSGLHDALKKDRIHSQTGTFLSPESFANNISKEISSMLSKVRPSEVTFQHHTQKSLQNAMNNVSNRTEALLSILNKYGYGPFDKEDAEAILRTVKSMFDAGMLLATRTDSKSNYIDTVARFAWASTIRTCLFVGAILMFLARCSRSKWRSSDFVRMLATLQKSMLEVEILDSLRVPTTSSEVELMTTLIQKWNYDMVTPSKERQRHGARRGGTAKASPPKVSFFQRVKNGVHSLVKGVKNLTTSNPIAWGVTTTVFSIVAMPMLSYLMGFDGGHVFQYITGRNLDELFAQAVGLTDENTFMNGYKRHVLMNLKRQMSIANMADRVMK